MSDISVAAAVEELLNLFTNYGGQAYIGEEVSQLEHASQCAELAREEAPGDEEVRLAAFLHDIGHLCPGEENMEGFGVRNHELVGAALLSRLGFSPRIQSLVRNHVQAKRYLCASNPAYHACLSEASKQTLQFQGGPMSPEEVIAFKSDELFELSLKMRSWDERAKVPAQPVPPLAEFGRLMTAHLNSRRS